MKHIVCVKNFCYVFCLKRSPLHKFILVSPITSASTRLFGIFHFIRWDQVKTTQSEKRGGGLARVGAAKRAGYCDPPPHLSHNRNDRRIHTPVTITLLQPAGSFVVGVATHHCHHLHPLTDLAGSTLSDHFRDVNTGEKNHGSSAREIQDLKPRPDPKPLPSFALISQRMESNTPRRP